MRYCLFSVAFFVCIYSAFSQSQQFMNIIGSSGPDNTSCFDDHGDIEYTSDGGFVVVGTIGETTSERDILLSRMDQNGDTLWTRILGTPGSYQYGRALTKFGESDFLLLSENNGSYCNTSSYLIRFNELGDTIWSKAFNYPAGAIGIDVAQSSDGNILALFQYKPFSINPSFEYGLMLVKIDPNGNVLWDRGYSVTNEYMTPSNIVVNTDGSILVSGQIGLSPVDMFLLKTDAAGNVLWINSLDIPFSNSNDEGYNIYSYPDGSTICSGRITDTNSTYKTLIYKVNAQGGLLWMKKIKLFENTRPAALCGIGYRVFIGGSATETFSNKVFLMEIDSAGNVLWGKSYPNAIGGLNECICTNTEIVGSGFVGSNYQDHLIIKTTDNGNACSASPLYDTTITLFPIVQNLSLNIESNITISQYCPIDIRSGMFFNQICTTTSQEEFEEDKISLYPNPTSSNFTIEGLNESYNLTIYSSLGQLLYKENNISETFKRVDVSKYPKGLFFIRIESEGKVYHHKLLKQ